MEEIMNFARKVVVPFQLNYIFRHVNKLITTKPSPFLMKEIMDLWRGYTGDLPASIDGYQINLKVLTSPEEQAKGFMFAEEPSDNFGLLFKYPEPRTLGFWMKNVSFDLDLLAFDEERRLFQVIRLRANDHTIRKISIPCRYVLELKAGWCERNGIELGMVLELG